jgi:hypothetical protein
VLFETLSGNATLTSLDLSANAFDGAVATKLRRLMAENAVLAALDLSHNQVGDRVALVFAETLADNASLTRLSLASCRVTDAGALKMIRAVAQSPAMRRLSLRDNFLSRGAGFEMIEIFAANERIVALDLSSNQVDSFAIAAIRDLCARNRMIGRQRKFVPLKREMMRLAIERAKTPLVHATCERQRSRAEAVEEENEQLQEAIDRLYASSEATLTATNRAIAEYEKMVEDEEASIAGMDETIKRVRVETETEIAEVKTKTEEDAAAFRVDYDRAAKMEADAAHIGVKAQLQKEKLTGQIARIEAMLAEVQGVIGKREALKIYQIPEIPVWQSEAEDEEAKTTEEGKAGVISMQRMPEVSTDIQRKGRTMNTASVPWGTVKATRTIPSILLT